MKNLSFFAVFSWCFVLGLRKFGPVKVFKWIEDEVFGAELQTRYILLESKKFLIFIDLIEKINIYRKDFLITYFWNSYQEIATEDVNTNQSSSNTQTRRKRKSEIPKRPSKNQKKQPK